MLLQQKKRKNATPRIKYSIKNALKLLPLAEVHPTIHLLIQFYNNNNYVNI